MYIYAWGEGGGLMVFMLIRAEMPIGKINQFQESYLNFFLGFLVLTALSLFYNEFFIYYVTLYSCSYSR